MRSFKTLLALGVMVCLLAGAEVISSQEKTHSQASATEKMLWDMEHAYWH